MRILKFGGSSIANTESFIHVANILEHANCKEQVAGVLSAPETITDRLSVIIDKVLTGADIHLNIINTKQIFIKLIDEIAITHPLFNKLKIHKRIEQEFFRINKLLHGISLLRYCPENIHAIIISLGEKLSIILMEALFLSKGFNVTVINPVEVLLARGNYLESVIDIKESMKRTRKMLIPADHIILMAGFIAGNENNELVILGRNGSDYSATALAACLQAKCCEIWKNVNGIYTCDPNKIPDAHLINHLSYKEAIEMSYFGSKILHPKTIDPIIEFQIPCMIKNTANSQSDYTLITAVVDEKTATNIKSITYLSDIIMISVIGSGMNGTILDMTTRIFTAISHSGISILLVMHSFTEHKVSFCVQRYMLTMIKTVLENEFNLEIQYGLINPIEITYHLAMIVVIGNSVRHAQRKLFTKLLPSLLHSNINIIAISQSASDRSISIVIDDINVTTATRIAHQTLFNANQIIEVFIIGVVGIGEMLIEKIRNQYEWLKSKRIDLRICGIANAEVLLINKDGIKLSNWKETLNKSNEIFNAEKLIQLIQENHLFNPVIIDCTTSQIIADQYVIFLLKGFHIVTLNNTANTASMDYYYQTRAAAVSARRKFLYDMDIIGSSVIESFQNLLNRGNKPIQFSGILSRALSFIFGKLDDGVSLSTAIFLARGNGYTQYDPRDDLSGIDVAKKLLILAREIGYALELSDIDIEPVLPEGFNSNGNVEEFLTRLPDIDNEFANRVAQARSRGRVLRYIGSMNDGWCKVKIESVEINNILFEVKNGENVLMFSNHYHYSSSLIFRSYGFGDDAIVSRVFTNLLRVL